MKFIVSSNTLLKELQKLGRVVENSSTLPIINNFLFELSNKKLKISATDLETNISCEIDVDSDDKDGTIAISAKMLLDMLKQFPDQPLTFGTEDDQYKISVHSANGSYSLAYVDADEFPQPISISNSKSISIQADILARAINKTIFATSTDLNKPTMNGVLFKFSADKTVFVATDSNKLALYERNDIKYDGDDQEVIIPRKALNLLKDILASDDALVDLEFNESNARFTFGNTVVICRLVDGKYPNYNVVIPKESPNVMIIGREELLNSIRRVALFSSKTNHKITFNIAGTSLEINAEDIDFSNQAQESLTCQYDGDDMEIGFNARIFTEILGLLISDNVQLSLSDHNKAGIITPADSVDEGETILMLAMPLLIR